MTTEIQQPASAQRSVRLRQQRRVAVLVVIASLSITALIGIFALLVGNFSELQGRIMLTTLIIGVTSVLALCNLAGIDGAYRWISAIGLVVAALTLTTGLLLIWTDWSDDAVGEPLWKTFGIAGVAAVCTAHASLLLKLGGRTNSVLRIGLWATIALIALLFLLISGLILTDGDLGTEGYNRLIGTVAILDVLGTIVVPVVALFLRDEHPAAVTGLERDIPDALESELLLLNPAIRSDAGAVDALLAEDFAEIGQSGRLWSREEMLRSIASFNPSEGEPVPVTDMHSLLIAPQLVLLRYVSGATGVRVRRSSIWRLDGDRWRVVFHQGTPCQNSEESFDVH